MVDELRRQLQQLGCTRSSSTLPPGQARLQRLGGDGYRHRAVRLTGGGAGASTMRSRPSTASTIRTGNQPVDASVGATMNART